MVTASRSDPLARRLHHGALAFGLGQPDLSSRTVSGRAGGAGRLGITAVRQAATVPVIAIRDIEITGDAGACLLQPGVDLVMIGRGVLGRVWSVIQVIQHIGSGRRLQDSLPLRRNRSLFRYLDALPAPCGRETGKPAMRKPVVWYCRALPGQARFPVRPGGLQDHGTFPTEIDRFSGGEAAA